MNNKKLIPTTLCAAILAAVGMTHALAADLTTGAIVGQAKQGTEIKIVSKDTGLTRSLTVDDTGRYSFTAVPAGIYEVTANGKTVTLQVSAGAGTAYNLVEGDEERLLISGARPTSIDVTTSENIFVYSADQLLDLPTGRDMVSVALLAPTTVAGDPSFGGAAFGGSSVAENGYYIDGFDVTNMRNMRSFASVPNDAVGETTVKVGGYGAEYGRSLGGVISQSLRRGTNEWKFAGNAYFAPDSWSKNGPDIKNKQPGTAGSSAEYLAYRSPQRSESTTYNASAGGPILEDRVFVYALVQMVDFENDSYGATSSSHTEANRPNYVYRLDWNINDNHILTYTGINNEYEAETQNYLNRDASGNNFYAGRHVTASDFTTTLSGGEVKVLKYSGNITDNFTVTAMRGELETLVGHTTPEVLPGAECVGVYDSRRNPNDTIPMGCWNPNQLRIRDNSLGPNRDMRTGTRLDFDWHIGDHNLRFGLDEENLESINAGFRFTGTENAYYRYFTYRGSPLDNGQTLPIGTEYVRIWREWQSTSQFTTDNEAAYIEDNWQITPNVMIYAGLRRESFINRNGSGEEFVSADDMDAPRLGAAWDINGDGSSKLSATYGRYFIPVAMRSNIDLSSFSVRDTEFWLFEGIDPNTGKPIKLTQQVGPTLSGGVRAAPPAATIAATNLEPMHQDEFTINYQTELSENWTGSALIVYRKVLNGMDDYCTWGPFYQWAKDNGYNNIVKPAHCVLINPGKDVTRALDLNAADGKNEMTLVTIPNSYLGNLPEYKREYKGITFQAERRRADGWTMSASYTWSHSYGNMEGYVNSTLNQGDQPGITQDFDHKWFTDGSYGDLPNDRRHVLKANGSYDISDEWRISGTFTAYSGRPRNCQGYVPIYIGKDANGSPIWSPEIHVSDRGTDGIRAWGPSSFYCHEDGKQVLHNRGDMGRTPWLYNFNLGIAYTPGFLDNHVSFRLRVNNLFDFNEVTEYVETSDRLRNNARTDVVANENYGTELNFQSRRSMSLSMHVRF